jgi:hypothetical protein
MDLRSAAIRADWRRLLINSLVLAVTIPTLFKFSGGEPVLAGWILSLFMVFYLFCCTCFFSNAATPLAKIFNSLLFVGLLAFLAGILVSNVLGMIIIYLDSFLAAVIFGNTLALYRESNGTKCAALIAVANGPIDDKRSMWDIHFFLGFLTILCCAPCVWVMLNADCDAIEIALGLFGGLHAISSFDMICVVVWLNGAFFGEESSSIAISLWFLIVLMIALATSLMGDLVGVIVLWICILAFTAFIGYGLRLQASYEQIRFMRYHN